jgi:hypothetical protein
LQIELLVEFDTSLGGNVYTTREAHPL